MDTDNDGVITRAEWRGNDQSFREHDLNHDGVLSGEEVSPRVVVDETIDRGARSWSPDSNEPTGTATGDRAQRVDRHDGRFKRWTEMATASSRATSIPLIRWCRRHVRHIERDGFA